MIKLTADVLFCWPLPLILLLFERRVFPFSWNSSRCTEGRCCNRPEGNSRPITADARPWDVRLRSNKAVATKNDRENESVETALTNVETTESSRNNPDYTRNKLISSRNHTENNRSDRSSNWIADALLWSVAIRSGRYTMAYSLNNQRVMST